LGFSGYHAGMSQLAIITPVDASGNPIDPGYGQGRPGIPHPPINSLPPVPPGVNVPDNTLPPGHAHPSWPITIPIKPDNTLPVPPGTIYPPLGPGDGIYGKSLLLVWVVGTDKYRWISIEAPGMWPPTTPEPKK